MIVRRLLVEALRAIRKGSRDPANNALNDKKEKS
jgi:hypothetical protein